MQYNYLFVIYSVLLGIFLFCIQVCFRIFRDKDEFYFETSKDYISNWSLYAFIIFCILQFVILISILYFLYKRYKNIQHNSKYILYLQEIIQKVYLKPLDYLFQKFANIFPGIIFVAITKSVNNDKTKFLEKFYMRSYFIFSYIPQLLAAFVFFVEICFYKKLHLFFYLIMFILVPILFDFYIKFKLTFAERSLLDIDERITVANYFDENSEGLRFSWKPSYRNNSLELLQEHINIYMLLKSMERMAVGIKDQKDKYYPYILLITTTLYLLGGLFRLNFFF